MAWRGGLCAVLFWCLAQSAAMGMQLGGEYTQLLFATDDTLGRRVYTDMHRLRLNGHGGRGAWSWRVSYDQEFWLGGLMRDPWFRSAFARPYPTWLDATATLASGRSYVWRHHLYRGWLRMEHGAWQWTLGRQRIAWGSGRIWNPTDRFNPVQPTALEPEQKLGVDALQARWRYSGFGGVRAVFAPGRKAHGLSRKWALRWADTLAGQDVALLLARTGEEKIVGFDLTGNMHDAGYRFEGLRASGGAMGSYAQIVIGLDGTWRQDYLPNGLYLALEYFFNGARQGGQRVIDRVQALSRQQLGALAGYDLTPLWRLDLMVLADLEQTGLFFAPRLRWSFKENVDIELLGQWPGGRGAYAAFSPTTALQLKYYF